MNKTFAIGTICYRCGMERHEKPYGNCAHWGVSFKRHLWNDKPLTMKVSKMKQSKLK